MRPPHLTTELDAMFLSVLKRALIEAGDTIPEGYGEIVAGLVTGGMSLKYVYDTFPTLRSPDSVWMRIDSGINYMAPTPEEMDAGCRNAHRSEWDRMAFRALTEANHILDK